MIDYENVHEVTAYNSDGYMQMSRKYLEGNADLAMPEDLYEDVKDEMPAPESDYDPVVRSELSDGTLTYYTRSRGSGLPSRSERRKTAPGPGCAGQPAADFAEQHSSGS